MIFFFWFTFPSTLHYYIIKNKKRRRLGVNLTSEDVNQKVRDNKRGGIQLGMQTGRFSVGTILNSDLDPFLNKDFGSGFGVDLEPILLVLDLIPVSEPSPTRGLGFYSKTD